MKLGCFNAGLLGGLHQTWQALGAVRADAIISKVVSEAKEDSANLIYVLVAELGNLIDKDIEHLNGHIFFFDLVGHHICRLCFTSGWCNFVEDISDSSHLIISLDAHCRL